MAIPSARVLIDGREVEVPAGTGLVEAAAELDIEIPVFCYEPRIGPAVGACRMCLVEIEGMPKLQTACSTPVRDGMVVSTVSNRARTAQESVLEFLLINHPLDCPVCDKGGECPLQDQAYRWGPGASRFLELKRNSDKPIPISPLIALDRERCILCYRCTRFSAEVSQDLQLVTRQRGAQSVIATFEGQPYEGHFSGNIIELCPVGALTSTEYRFKARPWEAPDHPTVCTLCPVGCNAYATVREGSVVRMLARENAAVDGGWLCDRGRFSYSSLYSQARLTRPTTRPYRARPAGNRPAVDVSAEGALEWFQERLLDTAAPALWVLSGAETLEEAFAVSQVAAASGGRVVALEGGSAAAPRHSATLADLEAAKHLLVVGDADLADVAPILDLRVRKAVRDGALLTTAGIGGTRLEAVAARHETVAPGDLDAYVERFSATMEQFAAGNALTEPGVVIYRDGELSDASLERLTAAVQLEREGSGLIAVPAAPNSRGLAALDIEPVGWQTVADHVGGVVLFGIEPDRFAAETDWWPALQSKPWMVSVSLFAHPVHELCDLVMPATAFQEKEGTSVSLEGRLQRLGAGAQAPDGVAGELRWLSALARRVGSVLPTHAAGVFRALAAALPGRLPVAAYRDLDERGTLGVTGGPPPRPLTPGTADHRAGELTLFVAPFLYDGADVRHADRMEFLHETTWITLARSDAQRLGLARRDQVFVQMGDRRVSAKVAISKRVAAGYARMHAGSPGLAPGQTGYHVVSLERAPAPVAEGAG